MTFSMSKYTPLAIGMAAMLLAGAIFARLPDVTLAELVMNSDFIAYGANGNVPSKSGKDGVSAGTPTVLFAPTLILKGVHETSRNESIVLCNEPNDVESYDLSSLPLSYFVFATKSGNCFRPILGVRSVVKVANGIAYTVAIADQPERQDYSAFVATVRKLVDAK